MKSLYEMVKDYVTEHGYKMVLDEDGSIDFRFQLSSIHVWFYNDDEHFMMVYITGLETVNDENRDMLVRRCNHMNTNMKQVKFFLIDKALVASSEVYVMNESDFAFQLNFALKNLVSAQAQYLQRASEERDME
jgi:hypothetical protein